MAGGTFCGYNAVSATKEIAIIRPRSCFLVCSGILLAACSTPKSEPPDYAPREVVTVGKWRVESAGQRLGQVVKFEIRDPKGPVVLYRIQDAAGRWLGEATENGRFTRRRPDFLGGDEDLGLLAMERGCALLFEASTPIHLVVEPIDAVIKKSQR